SLLKVRIQQLQNNALTPESILVEKLVFTRKENKYSTTNQNIAPSQATGSNKIKESTNRYGIMFIKHLLNKDCSQVMSWIEVQNNTKKIATGKTPKWFTEVQQMLAEMEYPIAKVLLGVVIDRKKKIYANIGELLEGRIHKEEKNQKDIRNFYLFSREQTILTIIKQFLEITQELWSLYQSLRVPKMVRVSLIITNNVEIVDQRQLTASWEILNTGVRISLTTRTWPSLLKNILIAIRSLGTCLRENSRVKLTTNYKEIKQLINTTRNLRTYQRNQIEKYNLTATIQVVMIILNRKQIIIESK
ncbi:46165_t:CDS:2, partial [Gigaspora margarita]